MNKVKQINGNYIEIFNGEYYKIYKCMYLKNFRMFSDVLLWCFLIVSSPCFQDFFLLTNVTLRILILI